MSYAVSNWSGSVQFRPREILHPLDEEDLREWVMDAQRSNRRIRVVGTGHSFTPLIQTSDLLISLDQMQGVSSIDETSGDVTLQGGTKLWKMNELLFEKGRCLENLGDINRQSIAGTVSTGTHGTGIKFGSISTQVQEMAIVTADGRLIECSENKNPELFDAARVSLGSLGIIARVKLKTLPAYRLHLVQRKLRLAQVLKELKSSVEKHRHFEFFCFPYSDWVQVKYADETEAPVSRIKTLALKWNAIWVENLLLKVLSEISRWVPGTTKPMARLCGASASDKESVNWAHELFASPRWVKFQEMEYSVPAESMSEVLLELKTLVESKRFRVHFPIECRYVKEDRIWLSPAYGRDSAYVAIHAYKGMPYEDYFKAAESIFRNHGGRPHWGKMHFLTEKDLRPMYPKWDEFQELRRELDPRGVFMNPALERLFLP